MSAGSLPYHLRLNKNVERQVFIDLLSRISSYKPIRDYSYFGFGGPFLEDFKLLHNHFEISQMYSIEVSEQVVIRQLFNKPASCISCLNITSGELINNFPQIQKNGIENIDDSVIVWLDYTSPSELGDQLLEFSKIIEKVVTGSIIKITINAAPTSLIASEVLCPLPNNSPESRIEKEERLREERCKKLEGMLGSFFLRDIIIPDMMKTSNYPTALYKTLLTVAHKALEGRAVRFEPICAFKYSDGQQMLTLTGIILGEDDVVIFKEKSLIEDWKYYIASNNDPMQIDMPYLSIAEKLHIDKYLPSKFDELLKNPAFQLEKSTNKTEKSLKNYQDFYRFYPNFSKVWV